MRLARKEGGGRASASAEGSIDELMDAADLATLFRPTGKAHGLPAQAYTEEAFWQLERNRLFSRTWLGCAFESDVAEPGDVVPISIGGWEIIITRDPQGDIHAFHNVCRHRAMRVVDKPCRGAGTMTCPWHSWTYNLQGQLVATPSLGGEGVNQAEGIDYRELGLKPIRCDSWLGLVFINVDGKAPPLSVYLRSIRERLCDYDLSLLRSEQHFPDCEFKGNWKLVVEGGVENYHMPWIHPGAGGHAGLTREIVDPSGAFVGMGTRWRCSASSEAKKTLPKFPHLRGESPADGYGWEDLYLFILPGTVVEVMSSYVICILILPLSHDRSLMRRSIQFVGEEAMARELAQNRDRVRKLWGTLGEQDSAVVEQLQKQQVLRTDLDLPTRFSVHWESAVHRFQKLIVDRLRR